MAAEIYPTGFYLIAWQLILFHPSVEVRCGNRWHLLTSPVRHCGGNQHQPGMFDASVNIKTQEKRKKNKTSVSKRE